MHEVQCPNLDCHKIKKSLSVFGLGHGCLGCERVRMMLLVPSSTSAALLAALTKGRKSNLEKGLVICLS